MKVSIIGAAGRVGSSIAHTLILTNPNITELVLKDIIDQIHGEAMDLQQAAIAIGREVKVIGTKDNLELLYNSDLVIIAAGIPLSKVSTNDRNDLLEKNKQILNSIMAGFPDNQKTKYIIITNPIDVMTYHLAEIIGDRKRVIGISTIIDTARMNMITNGYLIGQHSGIMVPLGNEKEINVNDVTNIGLDVVNNKGGSWFGTSSVVSFVANSILNDEQKQLPIAVQLKGEYGLSDTCLSVPCIVGKDGATIYQIELNESQKLKLQEAGESVKKLL